MEILKKINNILEDIDESNAILEQKYDDTLSEEEKKLLIEGGLLKDDDKD